MTGFSVSRLGFGAMRLTDWRRPATGESKNRRAPGAVELGVTFIDTADAYDPRAQRGNSSPRALHPYPEKPAHRHQGRANTRPSRGRVGAARAVPNTFRQQAETLLEAAAGRAPGVAPAAPPSTRKSRSRTRSARSKQLKDEGKIGARIGLSEVTVAQLDQGPAKSPRSTASRTATNLTDRASEDVPRLLRSSMASRFVPWLPIRAAATMRGADGLLGKIAGGRRRHAPRRSRLAWLLRRVAR